MSDSVQVYVRVRPLNDRESQEATPSPLEVVSKHTVHLPHPQTPSEVPTTFTFDGIFSPDTTQAALFEQVVQPVVSDMLKGYNACILAYGVSGSGKTHTMMGPESLRDVSPEAWFQHPEAGIIPRLSQALFAQPAPHMQLSLTVSYVEIYMERIRDLLAPQRDNLRLREMTKHPKQKGVVYIEGCSTTVIHQLADLQNVLRRGELNRATACTQLNERSSRSHAVLIINVAQINTQTQTRRSSSLFLVDLAGSEQVDRSGAVGQTLKEAQAVNQSLSTLSRVIHKLTARTRKHSAHIPYRDSKLTRLLTNALGGNSKTLLLMTCSPAAGHHRDTFNTLKFGQRAKRMPNELRPNEDMPLAEYRRMVNQLREQIDKMKTNYDKALKLLRQHKIQVSFDNENPDTPNDEMEHKDTPPPPRSRKAVAAPLEMVEVDDTYEGDLVIFMDIDDMEEESVEVESVHGFTPLPSPEVVIDCPQVPTKAVSAGVGDFLAVPDTQIPSTVFSSDDVVVVGTEDMFSVSDMAPVLYARRRSRKKAARKHSGVQD